MKIHHVLIVASLLVLGVATVGLARGEQPLSTPSKAKLKAAVGKHLGVSPADLRYACQNSCGSISNGDFRYLCQGSCGSISNGDARYACQGSCGSISNSDLRYFCQGSCGSI